MQHALQQSQRNIKLSDSAVAEQFVINRRKSYLTDNKIATSRRSLGVSQSLEDLAIVATSVKELTPEQTALIQINANLSVAGTDKNAEEVMPSIATESFVDSANLSVVDIAKNFSDIWLGIVSTGQTLSLINSTAQSSTQELIDRLDLDDKKQLIFKSFTIELADIADVLCINFDSEDSQYLNKLNNIRSSIENNLSNGTVKCINSIRSIIRSGLAEFGKDTTSIAQESYSKQNNAFEQSNALMVQNPPINNVYSFQEDEHDIALFKENKTVKCSNQIFEITNDTIKDLLNQANFNMNIILLSQNSCNLLCDENMIFSIKSFGSTVSNLLQGLPATSRTKQLVVNYCDMFINSVQSANTQLFFMLFVCKFIMAYNELITRLLDSILLNISKLDTEGSEKEINNV